MPPLREYWTEVLADSPVAYWRFLETSGTDAADTSGNGHTGTYVGGYTLDKTGALMPTTKGRSVDVDGIDGGVTVANHADLDADTSAPSTGHFSVEAWVYPTSATETIRYVARKRPSGAAETGWFLYTYGTQCFLYIEDADADTAYSTVGTVTLNAWNHIVGVIDRSTERCLLYVNGTVTGAGGDTTAVGNLANADNLGIGRASHAATGPFLGRIAEVAVYQSALSAARILTHYQARHAPASWTYARVRASGGSGLYQPPRVGATRVGAINPHVFVRVGSTDYPSGLVPDTLAISQQLYEEPDTCTCDVAGVTPAVGQAFEVRLGGPNVRLFAGTVTTARVRRERLSGRALTTVTATDHSYLLNRRLVLKRYASQSASAIIEDLIETYTSGFTTTHVQVSMATVDQIDFTYETVAGAISRVMRQVGGYWYIGPDKDIHAWTSATEPHLDLAIRLGEGDTNWISVSHEKTLDQIRTRVYVEGLSAGLLADVAETQESFPIESTDAFPAYGSYSSGVRVGTFAASSVVRRAGSGAAENTVDGAVSAGASSITFDDAVAAIPTVPGGGGWVLIGTQYIHYTACGLPYRTVTGIPASGHGAIVTAIPDGAVAYFPAQIEVATSRDFVAHAGDQAAMLITRNDTDAQTALAALEGGDGIHEAYIQDGRLSEDGCEARGDAELTLYADPLESGTLETRDWRVRPGATLTIDMATPWGISGTFRIQSASCRVDLESSWPIWTCEYSSVRRDLYDVLRDLESRR